MKPVFRRIASCRSRATLAGLALFALSLPVPAHGAGLTGASALTGTPFAAFPWLLQSALPTSSGIGFLPICLIMFLSGICIRQFIH